MAASLTGLEQVLKGFEIANYVKNNRNSDRLLRMIIFFIAFFFFLRLILAVSRTRVM